MRAIKRFAEFGIGGIPDVVRESMGRLRFSTMKGFMRGFMDMVFRWQGRFFLVDWKSNFLGGHPEAYEHKALTQVMNGHFYFLQYHLYAVALHRYLSVRVPGYDYGRHFGGIYYLFLRGIEPAAGPIPG